MSVINKIILLYVTKSPNNIINLTELQSKMTMKTLLTTLFVLGAASMGESLQCYVCAGTERSDCGQGKSFAMGLVNCHSPRVPYVNFGLLESSHLVENVRGLRAVCVTAIAPEFEPKLVNRGCGIFSDQVEPCEYLENTMGFENCTWCSTDKCNNRKKYMAV
ncbi:uncharacterized protein LOC116174397 [Photinus pyralis]|uniref:uncharacterized protein LOC116174397 n=1 Tax=Photinus pyralis TaxID=7054 RepID=UPI0012671934|nr:uncharacterized protein LOC116174397 [Photinus pyralis]